MEAGREEEGGKRRTARENQRGVLVSLDLLSSLIRDCELEDRPGQLFLFPLVLLAPTPCSASFFTPTLNLQRDKEDASLSDLGNGEKYQGVKGADAHSCSSHTRGACTEPSAAFMASQMCTVENSPRHRHAVQELVCSCRARKIAGVIFRRILICRKGVCSLCRR